MRTFWEDEIIRILVRPYIEKLENRGEKRINVLEMGCWYGDGYELLAKISDNMEYKGFNIMNLYGGDYEVEIKIPEMEKLEKMMESDMWIENSNYRENVIEPKLGYALRNMEMRM